MKPRYKRRAKDKARLFSAYFTITGVKKIFRHIDVPLYLENIKVHNYKSIYSKDYSESKELLSEFLQVRCELHSYALDSCGLTHK